MTLKPPSLIVRCYAEQRESLWVAVCVDFGLAAQGDSFNDASHKLDEQIREYVFDAIAGPDRQFGAQLLQRKAVLSQRLRYHVIKLLGRVHAFRDGRHRAFKEPLPLPLAAPAC